MRVMILAAALAMPATAQQSNDSRLRPGESWVWSIRTSHTHAAVVPIGDSVDVVLLRDKCRSAEIFGYHGAGCWDDSSIRVSPVWRIQNHQVARVRALRNGSWEFGSGSAGARVHAVGAGVTILSATLRGVRVAEDSIWVISAPGAVRIRIEPRPDSILADDTIRFRVVALDSAGMVVARIPMSHFHETVGAEDSLGFAPVRFYPWSTGALIARLGQMEDVLPLRFYRLK